MKTPDFRLFLSTIVFLNLFSFHSLHSQDFIIEGTLLDYEGNTFRAAHVMLAEINYGIIPKDPVEFSEVNEDGSFLLKTTRPGPYKLVCTAAHAPTEFVYIGAKKPGTVKVDIRLGTYRLVDHDKWLGAIGSFNDYDFSDKRELAIQPDSTFKVTVAATGDSTLVYLLGVAWGSAIAFPANVYIWKPVPRIVSGGYAGVFQTRGMDSLTITYDPAVFPGEEIKARVVFEDVKMARLHALYKRGADGEKGFMMAYSNYMSEHNGNMEDFDYDITPDQQSFLDDLKTTTDPDERALMFINYARLSRLSPVKVDSVTGEKALQELAPAAPEWPLEIDAVFAMIKGAGGLNERNDLVEYLEEMAAKHPNLDQRARALNYLTGAAHKYGWDSFSKYYDELLTKYPDTYAAKNAKKNFAPDKNIELGKMIPEYSVTNLRDESSPVTRENMKGRLYLIDFWATWCGPCIADMPTLHEVYDKFKGENFEILSISIDESRKAVDNFSFKDKFPMPWLNTIAEGGFESEMAETFEIMGIPKPILVNEKGEIVALDGLRGEELEETIRQHLNNR